MVQSIPLSWRQARSRLHETLEAYQSEIRTRESSPVDTPERRRAARLLPWWISLIVYHDIDIYVGACGASLCLLLLSIWTFQRGRNNDKADFNVGDIFGRPLQTVAISETIGSVLLFTGSLVSVWIIRRRRISSSKGVDFSKYQEISSFLKSMDIELAACQEGMGGDNVPLEGTPLTDIYPVYRLQERSNEKVFDGSWCKIPTLLLVEGDHIALQVGDIAPVKCHLVEDRCAAPILNRGAQITNESFGSGCAAGKTSLPIGRTTIQKDSSQLLSLCNNVHLFAVLETPLNEYLREKQPSKKSPQVHRQLEAIRVFSTRVSAVFLLVMALILFGRLDYENGDLSLSLPTIFLAMLGLLPLITPACLAFVEILGTARILVSYHPISCRSHDTVIESQAQMNWVLLKYAGSLLLNRLSMHGLANLVDRMIPKSLYSHETDGLHADQFRVPPASSFVLEKLGVATAFTLVDDELACEPHAIPQQLLIPSVKGLKLLDICPAYDDDESLPSSNDSDHTRSHRRLVEGQDGADSDSDSEDGFHNQHHVPNTRKRLRQLRRKKNPPPGGSNENNNSTVDSAEKEDKGGTTEVQFEDPNWWEHLPSLKCIGLACLLVDQNEASANSSTPPPTSPAVGFGYDIRDCKRALAKLICSERHSSQLDAIAQCIGFSTKPNSMGPKGDIISFTEHFRLHVISNTLAKKHAEMDLHERSSEESRWWGLLRPDSTSVIVEDSRSGGYQLVTVGDPRVVTRLCQEAWQGESATVTPFGSIDRNTILETTDDWKLGDLSVAAFSYSPVPYTFEKRCTAGKKFEFYLLDNEPGDPILPNLRDKSSKSEWPLLHNQIFLGVLGSLVVPRPDIQVLLSTFHDSGVRFVYFSPRNMRRQKEIASQMGIDVAWNCAISLRSLVNGEEDPHRMTSNYADWDVNAKLPHGVESVKQHLENVDNVPLLVSLFTDATKETTMEMVEIFQEYHDTVVSYGLSHLPRNSRIFAMADLAIGVDGLTKCLPSTSQKTMNYNSVLPAEVSFACRIAAHSCAFHIRGIEATAYIPAIIAQGRAALEAVTAATVFMASACLSFSLYALFSLCSVSVVIPHIPTVGAVLYLQVVIPILCLTMTMTDADRRSMNRVPPKNDQSIQFGRREGKILYRSLLLKALPPAILPQLLYLIAFGALFIEFEPEILEEVCSIDAASASWVSVIRCTGLQGYVGRARVAASALALGELFFCTIITSIAFVHRTHSIFDERPWQNNRIWSHAVPICIAIVSIYLGVSVTGGAAGALPWYYYILSMLMPLLCLAWDEFCKRSERKHYTREAKLRRLQFETRLGMWSPK